MGHDFLAVAFRFPPYSIPDYDDQDNNAGFEYNIARAITDALNLRIKTSPPSTGAWWGKRDEHGNYDGSSFP